MKVAMTIAGSDCSGGAGIQADLKTMTCLKVYGMSCITSLTAQNTTGVSSIMQVTPDFLEKQIASCVLDIPPDATKTGMIPSSSLVFCVAKCIQKYDLKNIVVDPVMIATSGARLIDKEAVEAFKNALLPLAKVMTPNIMEASALWGKEVSSPLLMEKAAQALCKKYGCAVLCKGGHSRQLDACDYLYDKKIGGLWFKGKRIDNPNTHGTGCTLSSAIAANLAKGLGLEDAIFHAKKYLEASLSSMLDLGKGSGPLDHCANIFCKEELQEKMQTGEEQKNLQKELQNGTEKELQERQKGGKE